MLERDVNLYLNKLLKTKNDVYVVALIQIDLYKTRFCCKQNI